MSLLNKPIHLDIKKQILERIKQGEEISKLAEEHGISSRTIYKWLAKGVEAPPTILELSRLKRDNQTLLELVGRLTMELSVEKKKAVGI